MIDKKMEAALNVQINEELFSAYLYQAMSADFADKNRPGISRWFNLQAAEETAHARKIYEYILERGGRVELKAVKAPQGEWKSPLEAFEAAYAHEQHITGCIEGLVKTARDLKDTATEIFLHWFVMEQVEEEAHADEIIQKIKQVGDSPNGLYLLDKELGSRQD